MVRIGRTGVVLVTAALAIAGCSGGDDDDDGGGADTATIEDGGGAATSGDAGGDGGDGAGPSVDGVDVPLHPSADAVSTTDNGAFTVVQYIVPLDQQADVIAFYDDWVAGESDDYQRTEAEAGGVSWQNGPDASEQRIIAVLAPLEGDDIVTVTLTVGSLE